MTFLHFQDYYKTSALELDYHRDNIYSRPTTSRTRSGTFLIIKARRRKLPENGGTSSSSKADTEIEGEIMGLVSNLHRFTAMFDFQYLPVRRTTTSNQQQQPKYEDILPNLFPGDLRLASDWLPVEESSSASTSAPEQDLFLPPFAFSRFTTSNYQILGREPQQIKPTRGSIAASAAGSQVIGVSLRKDRRMPCFMMQGHEPFPTEPHPETLKFADERCKLPKPNDILREIFDERPLWSKNAIVARTKLEEGILR